VARRLQSFLHVTLFGAALAVHRYWYLFQKRVAPPPGTLSADGLSCRAATVADVPLLGGFAPYRTAATLAAWIREPQTWLFLALDGSRPIAYECVTRNLPASAPFPLLTLSAAEVWVRDQYTCPEYRRRRAIRTVKAYRNEWLRHAGYERTLSAVVEDNVGSLVSTHDGNVLIVAGMDYRRWLLRWSVAYQVDARPRLERLLRAHLPAKVQTPSHEEGGGAEASSRAREAITAAGPSS